MLKSAPPLDLSRTEARGAVLQLTAIAPHQSGPHEAGVRNGDGWVGNLSEQVCPTPKQGVGIFKERHQGAAAVLPAVAAARFSVVSGCRSGSLQSICPPAWVSTSPKADGTPIAALLCALGGMPALPGRPGHSGYRMPRPQPWKRKVTARQAAARPSPDGHTPGVPQDQVRISTRFTGTPRPHRWHPRRVTETSPCRSRATGRDHGISDRRRRRRPRSRPWPWERRTASPGPRSGRRAPGPRRPRRKRHACRRARG